VYLMFRIQGEARIPEVRDADQEVGLGGGATTSMLSVLDSPASFCPEHSTLSFQHFEALMFFVC